MTKKINPVSSTKKEMYDAYKEVLAQLEEVQSHKLDPQAEMTAKKSADVLARAEKTATLSVEDQIAALNKSFASILGGLQTQFADEIAKFQNIQEAIKLKEAELQELIGIEKEAFTLAALVNTRKELSAKYDAEAAEKEANLQAKLTELNSQMQQLRIDTNAEVRALKAQAEQERERDEEEYNYDFNRKKKLAEDKLNDDLAAKRKAFNENVQIERSELAKEQAELDARGAAIAERESKMADLEATVASFPAREVQIRAEVAEQVKKDEAKTAAIKDNYVKREAENQKAIYEAKIELLEGNRVQDQAKIAELTAKLDAAYDKIQAMALASVDGSKSQAAAAEFARNFSAQSQK